MAQKYPGTIIGDRYTNSTVVEFGMALQNCRKFSHKRTNKK